MDEPKTQPAGAGGAAGCMFLIRRLAVPCSGSDARRSFESFCGAAWQHDVRTRLPSGFHKMHSWPGRPFGRLGDARANHTANAGAISCGREGF